MVDVAEVLVLMSALVIAGFVVPRWHPDRSGRPRRRMLSDRGVG